MANDSDMNFNRIMDDAFKMLFLSDPHLAGVLGMDCELGPQDNQSNAISPLEMDISSILTDETTDDECRRLLTLGCRANAISLQSPDGRFVSAKVRAVFAMADLVTLVWPDPASNDGLTVVLAKNVENPASSEMRIFSIFCRSQHEALGLASKFAP